MAPAQAAVFDGAIHRESANVGHHPPPPNDQNFQRIVNFMRAGLGDSTTTQGTGGTSGTTAKPTGDSTTKTTKETTTKGDEETMETTTKFDPSVNCGEPGTMVDWKGAKNSRILYRSMSGVLMRVNFFNNAKAYDIVSDPYFGFLGFAKKNCGIDFINALDDGRVSLKMYDWGAYYDIVSDPYFG